MSHSAAPLYVTPRDIALLQLVYAYHGCGVQHLHDRFWTKDSSLSATYRRIARLTAAQYLIAHRLPSLTGQGSGKVLLMLGPEGRRAIAEHLDVPLATVPRQKIVSSALFVQHHFAICDFRVALELATEQDSPVTLEEWTPEVDLRRRPIRVTNPNVSGDTGTRTITLVPDGAFVLSLGGTQQFGLLEQDMGTEAPKRLLVKLRGYLLHQRTEEVPLFFVTTTDRRRDLVRQLALTEAGRLGADASMVFVTMQAAMSHETILHTPIWYQAGVERPVALVPIPASRDSGMDVFTPPPGAGVQPEVLVAGRR